MIPNNYTPDTQCYRLLQALIYGPVNTHQLLHDPRLSFGAHPRRIKDVKERIKEFGYTIKRTRISKNCFQYQIEMLPEKASWWQWLKSLIPAKAVESQTITSGSTESVLGISPARER